MRLLKTLFTQALNLELGAQGVKACLGWDRQPSGGVHSCTVVVDSWLKLFQRSLHAVRALRLTLPPLPELPGGRYACDLEDLGFLPHNPPRTNQPRTGCVHTRPAYKTLPYTLYFDPFIPMLCYTLVAVSSAEPCVGPSVLGMNRHCYV